MVRAKIFQLGGDIYISVYSKVSRLHFGIPSELEQLTIRSDQTIYGRGSEGSRQAIDSFLLKNNNDFQQAHRILTHYFNSETMENNVEPVDMEVLKHRYGLDKKRAIEEAAKRFGVVFRIKEGLQSHEKNIVLRSIADICDYFEEGNHPTPRTLGAKTRIEYVDELLNPTILKRKGPLNIKRGTKSEIHPDFCILDLAVDFFRGCIANTERVINTRNEIVYIFKPQDKCSYCYARGSNTRHFGTGYSSDDLQTVRSTIAQRKKEFAAEGRKPRALRFGERTETFIDEIRDAFFTTIEGAYKEGVLSVITTKTPHFSIENAKLLKEFKASLLVSLDMNELSPGIVKLGFPNEVRLENAIKFNEAGVNVRLYPLTDLSRPLEEQKLHYSKIAYEASQKYNIPVQFLLVRPNSKRILEQVSHSKIIDINIIDQLPGDLFSNLHKGYYKPEHKNFYFPTHIHPFYIEIMKKRDPMLGVCAVMPPRTESMCTNCGISPYKPKMAFQKEGKLRNADEIRKIKRERYDRIKARKRERADRLQKILLPNEKNS